MAVVTKAVLKSYFENGKVPNYDKYVDLVDTMGEGDMLKSTYDTNDDGKVNSADNSDQLGGIAASVYLQRTSAARPGVTKLYRIDSDSGYYVRHYWTGTHWYLQGYNSSDVFHAGCRVEYANTAPWTGITGKPTFFPPSSHTHEGTDITTAVNDAKQADNADKLDLYHATDLYRDDANFATTGYLDTSSYVDAAGGFRISGSQGYIPILYDAGSFLLHGDWDFGELKTATVYTITRSIFAYPSTARAVILRIAGQTSSGTGYIGCNNVSTNYAYSVAVNTISDHPHSSSGMVKLTSTGGSFYIRIGNSSAYCQVQVIGYCL